MKTYRYQELKLQIPQWIQQDYRRHSWQVIVKEELSDEGKHAADRDLEEPDAQGDSREGHPGVGVSRIKDDQ